MPPKQKIKLKRMRDQGPGITKCPVCGHPVRRMMRDGIHLDSYKPVKMQTGWDGRELAGVDRATARKLKKLRAGKKTVALVGMATTTCALAPFEDKDVEIWALNEMHAWSWLKRADRWFQIHHSTLWQRDLAKRNVHGHREWLQTNPLNIPIYMQYYQEEVPGSVEYPLREVCDKFFKNIRRGDAKIKYFTSTFAYMMGIALLDGFERIELYGFEMSSGDEYIEQKGCAEFWIGLAIGRGIEIFLPDKSQLLWGPLYGYQGHGAANTA